MTDNKLDLLDTTRGLVKSCASTYVTKYTSLLLEGPYLDLDPAFNVAKIGQIETA